MINLDTTLLILITLLSTYPGVLIVVFLLRERRKERIEIEKFISEEKLQKMYAESLRRLEDKIFDSTGKNFDQFLFELGDELLSELDLRSEVKKLRKKLQEQTDEYTNYLKSEAQKNSQNLNQQTTAYLDRLEESVNNNSATLDQKTSEYLKKTRATLSERTQQLLEEVESQLQGDLRESRKAIRTYKEEKQKAVDDQAVELLEEALEVILKKKLDSEKHKEIIYEALEEAKREGFFG